MKYGPDVLGVLKVLILSIRPDLQFCPACEGDFMEILKLPENELFAFGVVFLYRQLC